MGKPDALTRRQDLQEGSRAAEAPPHTLLKPGQFIIGALQPPTLDSNLPLRSDILSRIRQLQPEDDLLQQLLPYLKDSSKSRPPEVSKRLEHLFINNRLVYYKDQIYIPDNHELKMDLLRQLHTIPALQVTLDKPRHMTSSLDTTISQVYATLSTPMLPVATLAHGTRSPAKNRTAHSSHSRVHPSLGSPSAWTPLSSSRHPKAMTPSWSLWIDSPNKPTLSIYS